MDACALTAVIEVAEWALESAVPCRLVGALNLFQEHKGDLRMADIIGARLACIAVALAAGSASAAQAGGEVNIYSYRQESLIRPLLDAFEKKTGIKSRVVFAQKGLIARMKAEGANSPADLLLTTDIGRLAGAVKEGVAQTVQSDILDGPIPENFRGGGNLWVALTKRLRVV